MTRKSQIGFSRIIELQWIEATANLVLAGYNRVEITEMLQDLLRDKLISNKLRGSREIAISILLRIWFDAPVALKPLQKEGLHLLQTTPQNEHVPIHWGMAMAVYPFFGSVAQITGRLLGLQGSVSMSEIQKRVREIFGERQTASRAAQRVVRTFVAFGALNETKQKGVYSLAYPQMIDNKDVIVWLIEALLVSKGEEKRSLKSLLHSVELFPFRLKPVTSKDLIKCERLEYVRQNLDEDQVSIHI